MFSTAVLVLAAENMTSLIKRSLPTLDGALKFGEGGVDIVKVDNNGGAIDAFTRAGQVTRDVHNT